MSDRDLKRISAKHKQIARLLVGGHSQTEIARLMEVHKSTVSRLVHDPLVVQEVRRLQNMADANSIACVPGIPETIQEGALRGAEVLIDILKDERDSPEMLKLKANVALEFLGKAGYGEVKQLRVEHQATQNFMTDEEIEALKRRAIENGLEIKRSLITAGDNL